MRSNSFATQKHVFTKRTFTLEAHVFVETKRCVVMFDCHYFYAIHRQVRAIAAKADVTDSIIVPPLISKRQHISGVCCGRHAAMSSYKFFAWSNRPINFHRRETKARAEETEHLVDRRDADSVDREHLMGLRWHEPQKSRESQLGEASPAGQYLHFPILPAPASVAVPAGVCANKCNAKTLKENLYRSNHLRPCLVLSHPARSSTSRTNHRKITGKRAISRF